MARGNLLLPDTAHVAGVLGGVFAALDPHDGLLLGDSPADVVHYFHRQGQLS